MPSRPAGKMWRSSWTVLEETRKNTLNNAWAHGTMTAQWRHTHGTVVTVIALGSLSFSMAVVVFRCLYILWILSWHACRCQECAPSLQIIFLRDPAAWQESAVAHSFAGLREVSWRIKWRDGFVTDAMLIIRPEQSQRFGCFDFESIIFYLSLINPFVFPTTFWFWSHFSLHFARPHSLHSLTQDLSRPTACQFSLRVTRCLQGRCQLPVHISKSWLLESPGEANDVIMCRCDACDAKKNEWRQDDIRRHQLTIFNHVRFVRSWILDGDGCGSTMLPQAISEFLLRIVDKLDTNYTGFYVFKCI